MNTIDWGTLYGRLLAFALKRHRLPFVDAEEMVQEAIRRYFDDDYANWDRGQHETLLRFLGSTINGLVQNSRRPSDFRSEILVGGAEQCERRGAHRGVGLTPSPEEERIAEDSLQQAKLLLTQRIAADTECWGILQMIEEGVDRPRHQAAQLGVDIHAVYNARRRLTTHVAVVRQAIEHDHET